MKTYELETLTNDTIILKEESQLEEFWKNASQGKEDFVVKWTEKRFFGGAKRRSKVVVAKKIQENVKNGTIKIYSSATSF